MNPMFKDAFFLAIPARSLALVAILLAVIAPPPAMAASTKPGGGSLQFSCTHKIGESPRCTCRSPADCMDMTDAGVCGRVPILSCEPKGMPCSCSWIRYNQAQKPGIFLKNKPAGATLK